MATQSAICDIPAYVISLPEAHERRRNMTERLGALGIPFRFVHNGIRGFWNLVPDEFDGAKVIRECFHEDKHIAITMEHRLVHRMIAESDSEMAFVFEDDANFAEGFRDVLAAASKMRFDVLKLEGGQKGGLRGQVAVIHQIGRHSIVAGVEASLGSAAYLIRRSAAARFCSLPVLDTVIDAAFSDPRLNLRVLECEPSIAFQDPQPDKTPNFCVVPTRHAPRPGLLSWARVRRLIRSAGNRRRLVRLYGFRACISFELSKHRGSLRRLRDGSYQPD